MAKKTFVKHLKRKKNAPSFFVHKTAEVEKGAKIGKNVKVWHHSQIRKGAKIGENCIIGKNVFIDHDVEIGRNCKIQNNSTIYYQALLEEGVFIGPHVCFTNDKLPRAIDVEERLKSSKDWQISTITIRKGASVGAHSVILPGIEIGQFALVGSGSVVTKNIPDFALVYGNPAKIRGFVCQCGKKIKQFAPTDKVVLGICECGLKIEIPEEIFIQKETEEPKRRIWLR